MFNQKTFLKQDFILRPDYCLGPYIYDKNGTKYLDLTAGGTSFNLIGSGNQFVKEAINSQLSKYSHLDCKTFYDQNREILSKLILAGKDFSLLKSHKVFFSGGSGSEAIEMAMHLSYQLHCESGNTSKTWFLSRNQSYHGATSGALSIGERPNLEFYRGLHSPNRSRVSECNYHKNSQVGESETEYTERLLVELEEKILGIGPEKISAFIGETMLGGLVGDVPPTPFYWSGVSTICKKYNIHLILDEVWSGTGVSGRYHCFEYDNVIPDFIVLGKSLCCGYIPLSAVIVPQILDEIISMGSGRIEMSCTFQGHSLAIASSLAVQRIILSDNFISNVKRNGEYIRDFLFSYLSTHPFVSNIRGRGVRNSIEFSCDNVQLFSQALGQNLFDRQIICSSKWHRISFSHAMNLDLNQIQFYLENFLDVFTSLSSNWSSSSKSLPLRSSF